MGTMAGNVMLSRACYRSWTMRASYLSQDRCELQFAVKKLARRMQQASGKNMQALKRLVRFLKGSPRCLVVYDSPTPSKGGEGQAAPPKRDRRKEHHPLASSPFFGWCLLPFFTSFGCGCISTLLCWMVLLGLLLLLSGAVFSPLFCWVVLPSFSSYGWSCFSPLLYPKKRHWKFHIQIAAGRFRHLTSSHEDSMWTRRAVIPRFCNSPTATNGLVTSATSKLTFTNPPSPFSYFFIFWPPDAVRSVARLERLDIGTSGAYPSGQTETAAPLSTTTRSIDPTVSSWSSRLRIQSSNSITLVVMASPRAPQPPLAFALALDVHRRLACQCVAGHDDASDLLLKGERHA